MAGLEQGSAAGELAFFTPEEARTMAALASRIFPDDDLGPGAIAAGVVQYVDRALSGAESHRQLVYRASLKDIERIANASFGRSFADSAPAQRDSLVSDMAEDRLPARFGEKSPGKPFFDFLRAHVLEGMFSDPVHGGNRDFVGWRLLGYWGPVPSYSHAEQQLDAVIVRDRFYSASDYPLRGGSGE
jgi:hypothetical protein